MEDIFFANISAGRREAIDGASFQRRPRGDLTATLPPGEHVPSRLMGMHVDSVYICMLDDKQNIMLICANTPA
jgi:hypothetical protein